MLDQLTDQELQQQLDAAKAGLNIGLAPTEFDLIQEQARRRLIRERVPATDCQDELNERNPILDRSQSFAPPKSY